MVGCQGNEVRELTDVKHKLMNDRDALLKQVVLLRKEITDASALQQIADQTRTKLELDIVQLTVCISYEMNARVFCLTP